MKESQFIKENKKDWKRLEGLLLTDRPDPEKFRRLFEKVSCDLSYARTFYPNRRIRQYLNDLINAVFDKMRVKKKTNFLLTIKRYYSDILPTEIIRNRKAFYVSTAIFLISVLIGVYSSYTDHEFLRMILGNEYVETTIENINNNDPMAIYKFENETLGFLRITINNIKVAFMAFAFGIFMGLGTIIILVKNGIMLGAFQSFFAINGLFLTSFLAIWIHGTIEISSIIVAGAAGIALGNSLLFPGTFSRANSLRLGAVSAITIMLSTLPLFVIAGFLEGFVTRQTGMPTAGKVAIITLSALVILTIYLFYPIIYYRKGKYHTQKNIKESYQNHSWENKTSNARNHEVSLMQQCSQEYIANLGKIIQKILAPGQLMLMTFAYFFFKLKEQIGGLEYENNNVFRQIISHPFGLIIFILITGWMILQCSAIFASKNKKVKDFIRIGMSQILPIVGLIAIFYSFYFLDNKLIPYGLFLLLPTAGFLLSIEKAFQIKEPSTKVFSAIFKRSKGLFSRIIGIKFLVLFITISLFSLLSFGLQKFILDFFNWHNFFESGNLQMQFLSLSFKGLVFFTLFPFIYLVLTRSLNQNIIKKECSDLKERLSDFASKSELR